MLSYDCEDIPPKEDNAANVHNSNTNLNVNATNNAANNSMSANGATGFGFNAHLQEKTKFLRDMWSQRRVKLDTDHSQLIIIAVLSLVAVGCTLAALTSNKWICDSNKGSSYGLWNSCKMPLVSEGVVIEADLPIDSNSTSNETITETTTGTSVQINASKTLCAYQGLAEIKIQYAEQSRVDQITASQGLIVVGTILYFSSILTIAFAYKFIKANNLNSVRNFLVTSMFLQIISFILQLIGFFLFILTEKFSVSLGLMFVYFGLAIFATNIINFITIEYKSYKNRQISI